MKDEITSWVASIASVTAACVALGSKAVLDPMLSVAISGVVLIGIAGTCLIGHMISVPSLYQWFGRGPGMAAETSVCFIIIGSGKIAMASRIRSFCTPSQKKK